MVVAALLRLLPHPPNFTPVVAIAIVSAACFEKRVLQIGFPLGIMLFTDAVLGFHSLMPVVYGALVVAGMSGGLLRQRVSFSRVLGSGMMGSLVFFVVSNFGVWFFSGMYPGTFAGLMACYVAAIPFFHNTLMATVAVMGAVYGLQYGVLLVLDKFSIGRQTVH